MARNVEVKARVTDLAAVRTRALALGARPAGTLDQTDRYYELDGGHRLKLRTTPNAPAELIRYDRPESSGVRPSNYEISSVRDEEAEACLVPKTPPIAVVHKRRELLLLDNVRIHLDTVDDLGTFVELEAILDESHDDTTCTAQVHRLTEALGLEPATFVRASYGDLILQA